MQNIDPFTGKSFIPTKQNQRFACRANQIRYNNQRAGLRRKKRMPIDRILNKNHKILIETLGDQRERAVSRDFLHGAGYSFPFHTHICKVEGQPAFCVFDLGIVRLPNNHYKVVKVPGRPDEGQILESE